MIKQRQAASAQGNHGLAPLARSKGGSIRHALLGLGWLVLLVAGAPLPAAAQTQGGDYARILAPDVSMASDFLRDTMGCEPLDDTTVDDQYALLQCGRGSVIEIVRGSASAAPAPAVRLRTEQVGAVLSWLRHRQVRVIGVHATGTRPDTSLVHVDVIAPWGQTLELVGPGPLPAGEDRAQLASD